MAQAPVFSARVPRDADVHAPVRTLVIHQLCPRAQKLQQVMVLQIMGPVLQMKKLGFPWRTLNFVPSHTILSKSPVSGELWDNAGGASWTPVDQRGGEEGLPGGGKTWARSSRWMGST